MTLTLKLPQEVVDRLSERARLTGLDVTTLVENAAWRESFLPPNAPPPPAPPANGHAVDDWDMPYTPRGGRGKRGLAMREMFAEWDGGGRRPRPGRRRCENGRSSRRQHERVAVGLKVARPAYPD